MITAFQSASMLLSDWTKASEKGAVEKSGAIKPQSVIDSIHVPKDLFSIHNVTPTEMKVSLYNRAGEALGLDMNNIDENFGADIKQAFEDLKSQPNGAERLAEITSNLDLDELGLTLEQLTRAIGEPDGEDAKLLQEQLKVWLDKVDEELRAQSEISRETNSPVILDDAGVYSAR